MNKFKQKIVAAIHIAMSRDNATNDKIVDAILDAMLMPTGKMVDEGACAADLSGFYIGNDVALECWRLMIQEAKHAD